MNWGKKVRVMIAVLALAFFVGTSQYAIMDKPYNLRVLGFISWYSWFSFVVLLFCATSLPELSYRFVKFFYRGDK